MAISLKSTAQLSTESGVKIVVYGHAGAGKTTLAATLPAPVILSAEGGLLSISQHNLPYVEIKTMADFEEVFKWLSQSQEANQFQSVAIDSISEIAEVCLAEELSKITKAGNKADGRAAYGELSQRMQSILRNLRDLPAKNVYFSAKMEKTQDEGGLMLYAPSMPGKSLTAYLPYLVDEVFALQILTTPEGQKQRWLLTDGDLAWSAKDRSGRLATYEPPHLGNIINKIKGVQNG